tara:strand:+ start:134 stop:235 length:102 start_codon:yes stop_codon:yes gene_type:complete
MVNKMMAQSVIFGLAGLNIKLVLTGRGAVAAGV